MAWRDVPAPVIAAIHGNCFGAGLQLALGADIRLATPDARLSVMEVKWGLVPDMGGAALLRELVPIDVAKELAMTGRILSGTEAHALRLVTHVTETRWSRRGRWPPRSPPAPPTPWPPPSSCCRKAGTRDEAGGTGRGAQVAAPRDRPAGTSASPSGATRRATRTQPELPFLPAPDRSS